MCVCVCLCVCVCTCAPVCVCVCVKDGGVKDGGGGLYVIVSDMAEAKTQTGSASGVTFWQTAAAFGCRVSGVLPAPPSVLRGTTIQPALPTHPTLTLSSSPFPLLSLPLPLSPFRLAHPACDGTVPYSPLVPCQCRASSARLVPCLLAVLGLCWANPALSAVFIALQSTP